MCNTRDSKNQIHLPPPGGHKIWMFRCPFKSTHFHSQRFKSHIWSLSGAPAAVSQLCLALQQTSKTESNSYENPCEQRLPILADLVLYYCRYAARPALIQLYQAEVRHLAHSVVFSSSASVLNPRYSNLWESLLFVVVILSKYLLVVDIRWWREADRSLCPLAGVGSHCRNSGRESYGWVWHDTHTHAHTHFPATGPQQIKSSILNTVKCLISCYEAQTEHDFCLGNMSYFRELPHFASHLSPTLVLLIFLFPLRSSIIAEAVETLWSGRAFKTFIIIIITTVIIGSRVFFSDVPIW